MIGRPAIIVFALSATACSGGEIALWLDLPPHEGKQTLLLAAPENDTVTVDAFDLSKGTAGLKINYPVEALTNGLIEAMLYDDTLAELNVPAGRLERAIREEDKAALPDADRSFRADVDLEQQVAAWSEATALSERLQKFRFAEPYNCTPFAAPSANAEMPGDVTMAVRAGPRHALIGTVLAETFIFGEGDGLKPAPFSSLVTGLFRLGENGPLWVGDVTGNIYQAEVDEDGIHNAVLSETLDPNRAVVSIAGRELDNGTFELFAMTANSSSRLHIAPKLFHFDGRSWISLGALPGDTIGQLVSVGPGRVFVRSLATGTILELTISTVDQSYFGSEVTLTSLDLVEGTGAIAGSAQGRFFRREGNEWKAMLGDHSYGWWSLGAAGFKGNIVFLIASGAIGEIDHRGRRCEESATLGIIENGNVLRLSDDRIFASGTNEDSTRMVILPRAAD